MRALPPRFRWLLAVIGQAGLSSACAAAATSTIDAGGFAHDATADVDAGSGVGDGSTACNFGCADASDVMYPACPAAPPPMPSPSCATIGEQCEYGSDWWLGCDTLVQCTSTGWQPAPSNMLAFCPVPDAGGLCPATWAEASAVDASVFVCPARECQYPEGSCACLVNCGAVGLIRIEDILGRWSCTPATSNCPSPRPDLGTPCKKPGWSCTYGQQCGCGTGMTCLGGIWQGGPTPVCP